MICVSRRKFDHEGAKNNITRDYLGPDPLFGKEFNLMFRLSKPRFQLMMEDIMAKNFKFFATTTNSHGDPASSWQARLLLPIKTLAYGVHPHA
jgi:hypothetical protein